MLKIMPAYCARANPGSPSRLRDRLHALAKVGFLACLHAISLERSRLMSKGLSREDTWPHDLADRSNCSYARPTLPRITSAEGFALHSLCFRWWMCFVCTSVPVTKSTSVQRNQMGNKILVANILSTHT